MSDLPDRITEALSERVACGKEGSRYLVGGAARDLLAESKALLEQLPPSILTVAEALRCEVPEGWTLEAEWLDGVVDLDGPDGEIGDIRREDDGTWSIFGWFGESFPSPQAAIDAITGRDAE